MSNLGGAAPSTRRAIERETEGLRAVRGSYDFFHAALLIVGHDVKHAERLIVAVIKLEEREYTMSDV